jgi:DNA end-binding protein Ku
VILRKVHNTFHRRAQAGTKAASQQNETIARDRQRPAFVEKGVGSMAAKIKQKKRQQKRAPKQRSSWRGMLRFGLVVFPVEAFNAHARGQGPIAFHQLHATCHSGIHYQKVCPVHGEVSNDEIVSGYEYRPGEYVEFEPEELDNLRSEKERALTIDAFISPRDLDAIYFDGRMYFLAPAGEEAKEPYVVLVRAMEHLERNGVGEIVFSGRKEVVLVRPYAGSLQMAMLNYATEIEQPPAAKPMKVAANAKTMKLAEELIENYTYDHFDFAHYVDRYEEELRKLIEAKLHGQKIVAPKEEEEPEVYNLMDALRRSMAQTKKRPRAAAKSSSGHPSPSTERKRRSRSHRRAS